MFLDSFYKIQQPFCKVNAFNVSINTGSAVTFPKTAKSNVFFNIKYRCSEICKFNKLNFEGRKIVMNITL